MSKGRETAIQDVAYSKSDLYLAQKRAINLPPNNCMSKWHIKINNSEVYRFCGVGVHKVITKA